MPNVLSPTMVVRYLTELEKDEATIAEAAEAYESAKAQLDVGLRRYIALRDFIQEQLGESPYTRWHEWPESTIRAQDRGRFRFTGMTVGDAVFQVLQEEANSTPQDPWLPLSDIISRLTRGGLGFPELVQARAVNAALLKMNGVSRDQNREGMTIYCVAPDTEDIDVDDLPFS